MRRFAAILLSLMLVVSMVLPVLAAATGTFLSQEYDIIADTICCYGKELPAGGYLSVSAGSQTLENVAIATLEEVELPVTVYCLVDSATSQSDLMKQQREDFLLNLSSLMTEYDNMVLGLVDENLEESKPMEDKSVRDTAIKTITGRSWMTNLYDGIDLALDSMLTNTSYYTHSCLVIISDGHDDGNSKAIPENMIKKIEEAGIPVYTVLLNPSNMSQKELEYHEQFAQKSLGGYLCYPDQDDISASMAAHKIWESIKSASAVLIDGNALANRDVDQQLLVRYEVGDVRYEDTILVRAVDMAKLEITPETLPTEPEPEPEPEPKPSVVWICIGVGAFLVIAGVVAFFLLRKKSAKKKEPLPPEISDVYFQSLGTEGIDDFPESPKLSGQLDPTMPLANRCHVYAVAIMHPEVAADFYLTPDVETTFGRTSKADIILCESDKKLSGLHGCFYWDGKMLLVRDMKSKNGTAVNGQNCSEGVWMRVEEGATLRVGNYEYRINFHMADEHNS